MTFINYAAREINCKIVYYGPGLCGKTTNLQYIYDRTNPAAKGKLISLATETDRTLFFDFLPLDLGTISGFKTRFQLYTVPGQIYYRATRKLVLTGADGVVFVADSQRRQLEENIESLRDMHEVLAEQGVDALAAFGTALFRRARAVAECAEVGGVRIVSIDATHGRVAATAQGDLLIVVLADREAHPGLLRVSLQRAMEGLA